jgi:hypothetical protein
VIKPEIHITGVEERKVYADKRTITINEEQAGTYSMTLNGKSIESGHVVVKKGTYNLSIEGKKLWLKSKKDITFKIDYQPPKHPALKNEIQPGYFQEANIELIKEDGITYDIELIPLSLIIKHSPKKLSKPFYRFILTMSK